MSADPALLERREEGEEPNTRMKAPERSSEGGKERLDDFAYPGKELAIFAHAKNWKAYWSSFLLPYLHQSVLEVGAGIGSNTVLLNVARPQRWVCLEPDRRLSGELEHNLEQFPPGRHETFAGTVEKLPASELFDTIIYIDVLEHIEDDAAELERAAIHLKTGGRLAVLSPAHQWLFSKFDAAIGHYRRYTRQTLLRIAPPGVRLERAIYLDAFGLFLSLGNRLLLRQSLPTVQQIKFWDGWVVPVSRLIDPILFHRAGKSILVIWQKT
jgi:SAM-dependent methyltransferase